jgi:hypothetical protein
VAKKRRISPHQPKHERWEEWGPLTPDVDVRIKGVDGWFHFRACVRNAAGDVWIDVYGGRPKHERFRSFSPDRIKLKRNGQPVTRRHRGNGRSAPEALELGTDNTAEEDEAAGSKWHVALDGAIVYSAAKRAAARAWVDERKTSHIKRNAIRPELAELVMDDGDFITTYYICSTAEARIMGFRFPGSEDTSE